MESIVYKSHFWKALKCVKMCNLDKTLLAPFFLVVNTMYFDLERAVGLQQLWQAEVPAQRVRARRPAVS